MKVSAMKQHPIILILGAVLWLSSCSKPPGSHTGDTDSTTVSEAGDYYTCSMHPQVHMDKPGVCPICGMDLVKASNSKKMTTQPGTEAMVPLNDRDQVLANVATMVVGYDNVEHTVRAYGNLEIPEPNKTLISARFNGRIEKLYVDAIGTHVKTGDPLFDIYSPDIVQAANEYLQSTRTMPGSQNTSALIRSKLELLGLTPKQIQDIEVSGQVPFVMTYLSPGSGVVIDKKIVKGSYVAEGTTLYEVSDISTLWNIADVYEADAGHITVGETACPEHPDLSGEVISGIVKMVYPVVNPQSRTVKVRLVVSNTSGTLRSEYVHRDIVQDADGRAISVPVGAVLITGKRNLVYVKMGHDNHFQAREVGLGSRV